jgi:hypothetical protein
MNIEALLALIADLYSQIRQLQAEIIKLKEKENERNS